MRSSRFLVLLVVVIAVAGALRTARAQSVVYSSGPTNGTIDGYPITNSLNYAISESFSLTSPATLSGGLVGLWVYDGSDHLHDNLPLTLNWAIGTSPRATDMGTGSASLINSYNRTWGNSDIYDSSFAIAGASELSAATTYWLTLYDATATDPSFGPKWDIQDWNGGVTSPTSIQWTGSEYWRLSFTLYAVPEPSAPAMLVSGLVTAFAAMALVSMRRRRAKSSRGLGG